MDFEFRVMSSGPRIQRSASRFRGMVSARHRVRAKGPERQEFKI